VIAITTLYLLRLSRSSSDESEKRAPDKLSLAWCYCCCWVRLFGTKHGIASSQWLSVSCRFSVPSAFMIQIDP